LVDRKLSAAVASGGYGILLLPAANASDCGQAKDDGEDGYGRDQDELKND
jgi:hypothetical protein